MNGHGIDLVEAALDLGVPGGLDFSGRDALVVDREAFRQPLSLGWRELPGFIEESLRVRTHGGIEARNYLTFRRETAGRRVNSATFSAHQSLIKD